MIGRKISDTLLKSGHTISTQGKKFEYKTYEGMDLNRKKLCRWM